MWSRKIAAAVAAGVLAAALVTFPAAAHGHHGQAGTTTSDAGCPVCTVEDCVETGRHTHDGHYYCGYDHSSGYCDRSCETASDSGYYCGGHHGCRR